MTVVAHPSLHPRPSAETRTPAQKSDAAQRRRTPQPPRPLAAGDAGAAGTPGGLPPAGVGRAAGPPLPGASPLAAAAAAGPPAAAAAAAGTEGPAAAAAAAVPPPASSFNASATRSSGALVVGPRTPTPTAISTAMKQMIRAYSTAVAPSSAFRNMF